MPGDLDVRRLDVADLGSVRSFAQAWTGDLDILKTGLDEAKASEL